MSYEVTATKKRPQNFDELIGQEFVVSTLKSSLEQGRIAHAYLFAGPRGVGKTSAARILAKALNCETGPTTTPCNTCNNCQEIATGNSLDVIEIDGASNTSVNDVREIKDEVLFAPSNSRYKVYIIDEVHMLSNSAFNALLKTIEEPPPYIVFIFATTEIHKVPPTIRSRCQQFNFRLIPVEEMKNQLAVVSGDLEVTAEDDALFWIAKEATGSLRDAYTLYDQIVSFSDGDITLDKITAKLGLVGFEKVNALAELLTEGNAGAVLETADDILTGGVSIEQFILDLTEYFRNILFIKNDIKRESLLGCSAERFSKKVIDTFTVSQIEEALKQLLQLFRNIRFSLNQRFELELVLSRLSILKEHIEEKEILEKIKQLRTEIMKGECPAEGSEDYSEVVQKKSLPIEQHKAPAHEETVEEDRRKEEPKKKEAASKITGKQLQEKLAEAFKKKMTLAANIRGAKRIEFSGQTITFVFDNSFASNSLRQDAASLAEKINEITGSRYELDFVVESGDPETETGDHNEQVELVKRVFRGEVVEKE